MPSTDLETLRDSWRAHWPEALDCWSHFVQLTEPRWCLTPQDEKREQLSGSFAMIRLVDHAVVVSLAQVQRLGLEKFAVEILAHEIGHHVYTPADLADNARVLARIRAGLPTKEHLAPFIANLYEDLLINDRLQRGRSLNLAGVYEKLAKRSTDSMWTLYMRMYELLWKMDRGAIAKGKIDQRLEFDAQLGARLIRSYAKDWLDGAGRFAALCLPYLLEDEAKQAQAIAGPLRDTQAAGAGGVPDGATEVDPEESEGAIHPSLDPDLSGVEAEAKSKEDDAKKESGQPTGAEKIGGVKSLKKYRGPFEYAEVLKATGANLDPADIIARYYRERALPYLIKFPAREIPESSEPQPEATETWDIGSPIEDVDWMSTVLASPHVIPGVTTLQRVYGTTQGHETEFDPIDLYLGVDCSGSMGNPARTLSYPVLAGAIIALSALRAGSKVMVVLSGEPGKTVSTDGFLRDEKSILKTLTGYLGTGTTFGIHRLRENFENRPKSARPAHLLIITDNDIFGILSQTIDHKLGWDAASEALASARGGATYVLQLPGYLMAQPNAKQSISPYQKRMEAEGWNVANVNSMEELLVFAKRFSETKYSL